MYEGTYIFYLFPIVYYHYTQNILIFLNTQHTLEHAIINEIPTELDT